MTRLAIVRFLAATCAVTVVAASAVVATGPAATAVQGQAVIAGQTNLATNETVVQNTTGSFGSCAPDAQNGLLGCGSFGLEGLGARIGVLGQAVPNALSEFGVYGSGPTGVYGIGKELNGVFGQTPSNVASGVYGQNDGTGYGVAGRAVNGTGVLADSEDGTALNVQGKIVSKRSGIAVLQASVGLPYVSVSLANMTPATFIVATVQGNVAGVWVRSVGISPPTNTFKIYLNKVPTTDVRIGWFAIR